MFYSSNICLYFLHHFCLIVAALVGKTVPIGRFTHADWKDDLVFMASITGMLQYVSVLL